MILYHGSNVPVRRPRLLRAQRRVDFGKGFYTTTDFEQAKKWAVRTSERLGETSAYVSVYELDDSLPESLKVLKFEKADEKWLKFVSANRKAGNVEDEFDLIAGPVANDQTMPVIDLYLDGILDEADAIRRLLPQKLKDQVVFKTEAALKLLKTKEVISL